MALTPLTNNVAVTAFSTTTGTTTKNYAQSLSAGTLVVFGYQNSAKHSSTVTSVQDSAGNAYSIQSVPGNTVRGTTALIYCRLSFAVTTGTTITFTAAGTQKAVYSSFAIRATGVLAFQNVATTTSAQFQQVGTPWTTPILSAPANTKGLMIGVFGFYNSYGFTTGPTGTTPTESVSPDVFIRFYDGGSAGGASIGLAYEAVNTSANAADYTVNIISSSYNNEATKFIGITGYFTDTPIRTINSVIEMF